MSSPEHERAEGPQQYVRPFVFGILTVLVFIFLIVAMSVEAFSIKATVTTLFYSASKSVSYTLFTSGLEDEKCDGFPDMIRAPRAFLILAILGVLPSIVLVVLDALKKTTALGPIAPYFKVLMACVAGYMAFWLTIAWPIMMALPSTVRDCLGTVPNFSISVKLSAAPIIALIAWMMACAMVVVAIFVPAPPQEIPPPPEVDAIPLPPADVDAVPDDTVVTGAVVNAHHKSAYLFSMPEQEPNPPNGLPHFLDG